MPAEGDLVTATAKRIVSAAREKGIALNQEDIEIVIMFKKLSKVEKYFLNPSWAIHELTRVVARDAGGNDLGSKPPFPQDGENGGSLASMITSAQQRIDEHERFDDPVLALMTLGLDPDGKP